MTVQHAPHPLLRLPRLGFAQGFAEALDGARLLAPDVPDTVWEAVRHLPLHGHPSLARIDAQALARIARGRR